MVPALDLPPESLGEDPSPPAAADAFAPAAAPSSNMSSMPSPMSFVEVDAPSIEIVSLAAALAGSAAPGVGALGRRCLCLHLGQATVRPAAFGGTRILAPHFEHRTRCGSSLFAAGFSSAAPAVAACFAGAFRSPLSSKGARPKSSPTAAACAYGCAVRSHSLRHPQRVPWARVPWPRMVNERPAGPVFLRTLRSVPTRYCCRRKGTAARGVKGLPAAGRRLPSENELAGVCAGGDPLPPGAPPNRPNENPAAGACGGGGLLAVPSTGGAAVALSSSGIKSIPSSVAMAGTVMAPWQWGHRPRWPPYCSFMRRIAPQLGQLKTMIMTSYDEVDFSTRNRIASIRAIRVSITIRFRATASGRLASPPRSSPAGPGTGSARIGPVPCESRRFIHSRDERTSWLVCAKDKESRDAM